MPHYFAAICKFRNLLILSTGIIFILICYTTTLYPFVTNIRSVNSIDRDFEKYQNKTYNPGCTGLNENEWRNYKELTTPNILVSDKEKSKLGIEDLGFVTFTSKNHMKEAM